MSTSDDSDDMDGIAIIGMACRLPGADTPTAFWDNLCQGVESITFFSDAELLAAGVDPELLHNPNYVKAAPLLLSIDTFDAPFFGYSPKEASLMDPQQRLFLEVAWEAFEDAGYNPESHDYDIGVFAGGGSIVTSYLAAHPGHPDLSGQTAGLEHLCTDREFLSTRVSYKLNLTGPSLTVQTACSTSLVALHLACRSLRDNECAMALAGASAVRIPHVSGYLAEKGNIYSLDGHCRAFAADGQGTIFGSGVGAILLKPLKAALADRDHIYAVVKGTAINNDGGKAGKSKISYTAPSAVGQARAMRKALQISQVSPQTVRYIECHATGTTLGDPLEIEALSEAFGAPGGQTQFCAVGSVKTNIGHPEQMAGLAGLMKTALILKHKRIPASLHFQAPNPHINFDTSPFYVNDTLNEWSGDDFPRRAAVNSLGIGGTNAFAVLEETPEGSPFVASNTERPVQLFCLSAKTEASLLARAEQFRDFLETHPNLPFADLCYTTNVSRSAFPYRFAVTAQTPEELQKKLSDFVDGTTQGQVSSHKTQKKPIAFLFTGQGSQYPSMAADLYHTQPVFQTSLEHSNALLEPYLEKPLLDVLFAQNEDALLLHETVYTQPALFAVEYALAQLLQAWGIIPSAVMGHSIGELVAACIAGVVSVEDALRLVAMRGILMQSLPKQGTMVVVFATESVVEEFVAPQRDRVAIAAINGPEQVVVSGERGAVGEIVKQLEARSITTQTLTVSHAFHSPLMDPILDAFEETASQINCTAPRVDLISNVTGEQKTDAPDPRYWREHVRHSVRFADGMLTLHAMGYEVFLEVGPGTTLLGMGRRCLSGQAIQQATWLPSLNPQQNDWQVLLGSLQKLYLGGHDINWQAVEQGYNRQRIPLPTYPFQRKRYWLRAAPSLDSSRPQKPALPQPSLPVALRPERNGDGRPPSPTPPPFADWLYQMHWNALPLPIPLSSETPTEPGCWLVFADQQGVGHMLAELFSQRGDWCSLVTLGSSFAQTASQQWTLNPARREDFDRLIHEFLEIAASKQGPVRGVLYLWGLDSPSLQDLTLAQLEMAENTAIQGALFLTQALVDSLLKSTLTAGLWFITRNAQHVSPLSPAPEAAQAPLWGLGRVVPLEYPRLWGGMLDLSPRGERSLSQEAEAVLAEVLSPHGDGQVALRNAARFVARFVRLPQNHVSQNMLDTLAQDKVTFRPDATYLITGGLGMLGLKVASWLVQNQGVRSLVLTSRSAAQGEAQAAVRRLKKCGATVHVIPADITVEADVQRLIEAVEQFPPLKGVIHCAGLLDDGILSQLDWHKFTRVTAPKVKGSWLLHQYTKGIELDFFLFFSSISSLIGWAGQANYVAGNAFMDMLAAHRRACGLPAMTIHWGPWDEAGMATLSGTRGEKMSRARGMTYIPPEGGMQAFDYLMHHPVPDVAVTIIDWNVHLGKDQFSKCPSLFTELAHETQDFQAKQEFLSLQTPQQAGGESCQPRRSPSPATPQSTRRTELVAQIREQVMVELGFDDAIDIDQPLNELGLDSLMAVRLSNRLEDGLSIPVPTKKLIQGPSINQLIDELYPDLVGFAECASVTQADNPQESYTSRTSGSTARNAGNGWLVFPKPNDAALIRLFCFPFAGGNAETYRSWPASLDARIEVVAIEPPGRRSRIDETPIQEFDTFLNELVPTLLPYLDKPFAFFGHCLGGLTLFETARMLLHQYQLSPQQIFVSGARPPHRVIQEGHFEEELYRYLLTLNQFDINLRGYEQPDEVFAEMIRRFNIGATDEMLKSPELRELLLPTIRADFRMAYHYRFKPEPSWEVPITCFTGLDDPYVTREDALAWSQYTKTAFRIHMREGAHFMVVEDKNFLLEIINHELN